MADFNQEKLKQALGLEYLTRAKLDSYTANLYLLKDIWKNNRKSEIHNLGFEDPAEIPFYPVGDSYKASTSGSKYNHELIIENEMMIEYDFSEAYTNIMRTYYLPSNTYLDKVKYTTDKMESRLLSYPDKQPYREMKTFTFFKVDISAVAKDGTYTEWGSMFSSYTQFMTGVMVFSEVELKLIYDFYDIKKIELLENYTFRCKQGLLNDYFERIDELKLQDDEGLLRIYKQMRNKIYGTIGKTGLNAADEKNFKFPIYNRAFSSMVAGVFRDRIARYEQKYVNSDYGLIMIKTDGLYFRKEVPEFENLYEKGIVKRKVHVISSDDVAL